MQSKRASATQALMKAMKMMKRAHHQRQADNDVRQNGPGGPGPNANETMSEAESDFTGSTTGSDLTGSEAGGVFTGSESAFSEAGWESWLVEENELYDADDASEDPSVVEDYEMSALEIEMCGEYGVGGAFHAAYQFEPEEPLHCPDWEDYVWGFILQQPLSVCFLEPQDLRNGFECVTNYMEHSPIPQLYHLMEIVTGRLHATGYMTP